LRQRFTERAVIIPSGDLVLEGLWQKGAGGVPVAIGAPHPSFGGAMDSPVVSELAHGLVNQGAPTIRFNYRGVGGSQGQTEAGAGEVDDYLAAAEHLLHDSDGEGYCAAGYSFGAWAAVSAAARDPRAEILILIAPANRSLDFEQLSELRTRPVLVVVGEDDEQVDVDVLRALLESNPTATVEVVPYADHFFNRGLVSMSRLAAEWYARQDQS